MPASPSPTTPKHLYRLKRRHERSAGTSTLWVLLRERATQTADVTLWLLLDRPRRCGVAPASSCAPSGLRRSPGVRGGGHTRTAPQDPDGTGLNKSRPAGPGSQDFQATGFVDSGALAGTVTIGQLVRAAGFEPAGDSSEVTEDQNTEDPAARAYTQIRAQIPDADKRMLAQVVESWPRLSGGLKLAILSIVDAAKGQGGAP
jgi:hypothetical protein